MKTELQIRAENALERFKADSRKPIIIEFAGVPKAGKTSTLTSVYTFFKRCKFKVRLVVEQASICPINDKRHFTFNAWTASETLAKILENTQGPPPNDEQIDILFVDRGLFDAISLLTLMEKLSRITAKDRATIERFLTIDEWRKRITGVIVMTTNPKTAMKREQGYLPVEGASSSIMTPPVLRRMRLTTEECIDRLRDKFRIFHFDTSNENPRQTVEAIAKTILNLIEEELNEDILCLPKRVIKSYFRNTNTLSNVEGGNLVRAFSKGKFFARKKAEAKKDLVQAIPVVLVRDKSGRLLCLRRRERVENKLNEKLVIWAGGHVRREDGSNGSAVIQCALRELKEELRLNIEPEKLNFLGAVYADVGNKTSQHVALVFEWRADRDDVNITLSTVEFIERRGTSVSGRFFDPTELPSELTDPAKGEIWSREIINRLLIRNSAKSDRNLPGVSHGKRAKARTSE
ncbi:MAG: NUDIX domain-containing protein [Planctomycetes bacterium]|nr:NUDIX domain-containing protein [Planctomycetota bacterium]